MKAIEQYFHVVLFIMLYKVVLIFKSVNETLMCDHPNVVQQYFHCVPFIALYKALLFFTSKLTVNGLITHLL